jgi:hypothetical protein
VLPMKASDVGSEVGRVEDSAPSVLNVGSACCAWNS